MPQHAHTLSEQLFPQISGACRPWTRWWWMGSAVDEAEITRHLQLFHESGFGGVEISPIYGAEGEEARFVPFLSERWIDLLRYAVREARRLDMDVDLICGTGWPFGGPWVSDDDAAAHVLFESYTVSTGEQIENLISTSAPHAALQTVMAFAKDGQILDLHEYVDAERRLHWTAPIGQWRVYAVFQTGTGQSVKRAAPGGEGNVVDHFSAEAIARYLAHFDRAFPNLPAENRVRCVFNDSYEVYGANWTRELFPEFQRRRGYDLRHHLPALCGEDDAAIVRRVRSDYRQTVADLVLDAFVQPWTTWAHRHGITTRNQAHGAPGNVLDLYAAADIGETETFGTAWLQLAGLEPLPNTPPNYGGRAEILLGKLASSAAHVAGKPLCSAEAFTWLGEHGHVPLAHMKAELDVLFVMGVNHVFFHGTPFSPADAPWPGSMFYAATHVAPTNPCWRDLGALNNYISRCQSFLQAGQPDNDLLLYFPIFDLWAKDEGAQDLLHFLTPHNTEHWLHENLPDFTATARHLWDQGYSFDCVSDQLLEQASAMEKGRIKGRGGTYRALMVAGCALMPPETLERILDLARAGGTVLIVGDLPQDVPGLSALAERRERFRAALERLGPLQPIGSGISECKVQKGRLLIGSDVEALLQTAAIRRESVVDTGVEVIRRRDDAGYFYFLTNVSTDRIDQWINLPIQAASVLIFDPLADRHGIARIKTDRHGETPMYLQLEPGQSVLLRTYFQAVDGAQWRYMSPSGQPTSIEGTWLVEFIAGGPTLPEPGVLEHLTSWTAWEGDQEALQAFGGTVRYTIRFPKPAGNADAWALDLGVVCHSARVKLNGQELRTLFTPPFRMVLPTALQEGDNELQVEVTNLMANRLAYLDRQGKAWRKFFFVNIKYEPFDAADWEPLPSGLLGPVQLVPLQRLILDDPRDQVL